MYRSWFLGHFARGNHAAAPVLGESARRTAAGVRWPWRSTSQAAADLVLLLHQRDGLVLVDGRPPLTSALGVRGEGLLQLIREPEVVDHQAAGLVLEHAVDARDRLHQAVAAHLLVDVHRVQARGVEARQPHVAHEDDLQRVAGVAEALRESLAAPCCGCAAANPGGSEADPVITTLIAPLSSSSCSHSGRSRTSSR